MLADVAETTRFGPARITAVRSETVFVATRTGEREAVLALALPYLPVAGDVALILEDDERAYIIGILAGRGRTTLEVGGDLILRAAGTVRIQGARGIDLESPRLAFRADRIEASARVLFEHFVSCYRWVKDTVQTQAGRIRTNVEGSATMSAERILESAEKEVKIDARQIHLG